MYIYSFCVWLVSYGQQHPIDDLAALSLAANKSAKVKEKVKMMRRIRTELCGIVSGVDKTIALMPMELRSDGCQLKGFILAPEGTPMENYVLSLSIRIYNHYPFKQPAIAFESKVWHPCVDLKTGELCMFDPGCPDSNVWEPRPTLETCLASVQDMLLEPFLSTKYMLNLKNEKAYDQFSNNRDQFNRESKTYAEKNNEGYGKISFDDRRIA